MATDAQGHIIVLLGTDQKRTVVNGQVRLVTHCTASTRCHDRYLTGMLHIRRAFHAYTASEKRWHELRDALHASDYTATEVEKAIVAAIQAGLDQGLGVLNMVLGALPPKIASMIGFFGLRGDTDVGTRRLGSASSAGSM